MAAPVGNQFWKQRTKHGRDRIFETPEILWEAASEYFEWCDANPWFKKDFIKSGDSAGAIVDLPTQRPYTWTGLALFLNCDEETLRNLKTNKDFLGIYTRIRETIYTCKFEGATVGAYNANIIARDLGLVEKSESKVDMPNAEIIIKGQKFANAPENDSNAV